MLADEYALMHKTVFFKRSSDSGTSLQRENDNISDFKNKWVPTSPKSRKECSYCHKMGHTMAECRGLKRKQERQEFVQPRGSVLVKTVSSPLSLPSVVPDICFQPFVFDGFVSLDDGVESQKQVL